MNINSLFPLLEQYGLGIALLFGVGYIIVNQRLQFNTLTDKIDSVSSSLNARIDKVHTRIDKHEEKCEARHKDFIKYMKEHEGRISRVEARLDERQQQPAT